jgi:hypothetical protein
MPASPPCGPTSSSSKKTQRTEVGPNWKDIVGSGVVNSDTAMPGTALSE